MLSSTFTNRPTKGGLWLRDSGEDTVEQNWELEWEIKQCVYVWGGEFISLRCCQTCFKRKHNHASWYLRQGTSGVSDKVNGHKRWQRFLKPGTPASRTIYVSQLRFFNSKTKTMALILQDFCEEQMETHPGRHQESWYVASIGKSHLLASAIAAWTHHS